MMRRNSDKTFGSCISANVRRALRINNTQRVNYDCGSEEYWQEACEVYGEYHGLSNKIIEQAKALYSHYKNNPI